MQSTSIKDVAKDVLAIYKQNEDKLSRLLKFIGAFILLVAISGIIDSPIGFGRKMLVSIVGAAFSAISSAGVVVVILGIVTCFYISIVSIEIAALILVIFFIIFVLYVRIFPKESLIIPIFFMAYWLKIPYAVPIFIGLFIGVKGVGATIIAVFLQQNLFLLEKMVAVVPQSEFSLMGALDNGIKILEVATLEYTSSWVYISGVFSVAILVVWFINNMFIDHEDILAIGAGGIVVLAGSIVCKILGVPGISIISLIIGVIIGCIVVYILKTFEFVLDYPNTERVKFQDENFVYYVRAIPKIKK